MTEWKEMAISEIIDLIGGGTPKTSNEDYWNGGIPWLSVVDFNNGHKYVVETEKDISKEGLSNSSIKLLDRGDIIISARGTVGVVAMLGKAMTFNQSCYGIKAKRNVSTNEFVYYLLKQAVNNLKQISHGGVFDTITRDTFKEIKINLPSTPRATSHCLRTYQLRRQNRPAPPPEQNFGGNGGDAVSAVVCGKSKS